MKCRWSCGFPRHSFSDGEAGFRNCDLGRFISVCSELNNHVVKCFEKIGSGNDKPRVCISEDVRLAGILRTNGSNGIAISADNSEGAISAPGRRPLRGAPLIFQTTMLSSLQL